MDVSLNGQGAPLVPIGDLHLFKEYKYCVNLGGFANISIKKPNYITAFDICPVNIVLNKVCEELNTEYDNNGKIARQGLIIPNLLKELNKLNYYDRNPPKSLSREWVEKNIYPLLNNYKPKDVLCTFCEHIAIQVGKRARTRLLCAFNKGSYQHITLTATIRIFCHYSSWVNPWGNAEYPFWLF